MKPTAAMTSQPLRLRMSATPATFLRATIWAFVVVLVSGTLADPDLWGHLRFGLDMIAARAIHTVDPYSFTADRPWVNHEWLAELWMGLAYSSMGSLGLGLLKSIAIAVVAGILLLVAREEGAKPLAGDLFVAIGVLVSYSRTQVVRPQLFSVAIFCVLFYLLRRTDRGARRALWCVPLCFALWANVHGAWIVGGGVLGVWMAGDLVRSWSARRAVVFASIGILSALATLINPYGLGLWQFVAETVRPARPDITDWKPLLALPPGVLAIEAILPALALLAWAKQKQRQAPDDRTAVPARAWIRDLGVIALLLVATLRVGRVDAFLQIAIAMVMARPLVQLFNGLDLNLRPAFRRPSMAVGALTAALAAHVAMTATAKVQVIRVEGHWIPDQSAALVLREARPGARVLTWFDWGEYALWQLSPAGIRVSMDGRRETVYSEQVTSDHQRFYAGQPDMIDYPDRIGADHVWLPSDFPMVEPLQRHGWTKVLDTGKSVVLARHGAPIEGAIPKSEGEPLFPWP